MAADPHQERLKVVLMRIIEGFSDYFVMCLKNSFHETPKNVSVRNISVEKKLGATGIHIVKVQLDSNLGSDEASIAVKIYLENDQALEIVKQINILEKRLSQYTNKGISSPAVIFFSGNAIVMQGIQGNVFRESKIPKPQKYRYAGRSLAAFHGSEPNLIWFNKYKLLISKSLENLPISQEKKYSIYDLFKDILPKVELVSQNSGAISFGDFHPGNLIFDVRLGRNPMVQTYLIDPEYLNTSTENDRLEDICNFFAVETVDQFRLDQNLFNLRTNLKSFLTGYSEILAHEQTSLKNFYLNEYIPINFHLSLMILMSILNIQNMNDIFEGESGIKKEVNLRCLLIEKLLKWESFPY